LPEKAKAHLAGHKMPVDAGCLYNLNNIRYYTAMQRNPTN